MPPPAKLSLLGGFRLESAQGGRVAVTSLKGRALLAYLALAKGRSATREHLALLLWSDSDSRKSRQNLRQVLLKLSRTLRAHGLSVLRIDGRQVALRGEGVQVDVWDFDTLADDGSLEALRRAARLYRGEFLHGMALDAPVFGDWLADTRARLQDRALICLHALLESEREAGDLGAAAAAAHRALEIDPCQEAAHRDLMALYLARGQRGAAVNQYRTCRAVLRRDLDVAPDPATEALHRRIREEMAEPDPLAPWSTRPDQASAQAPEQPSQPPPLGRSEDLKALQDAFSEVGAQGARLFALRGEAGIGKTRLLDAFAADLAGQGVPVHRVAARRSDRLLSLGLWVQLADSLRASADREFPAASGALAEVSPPYMVPDRAIGGAARDAPEHWSRAFDRILGVLHRAAAIGPLAVFLEDVQWADGDSLRLVAWALRRLDRLPVLFVTAARLGEEREPARFAPILRDLEKAGVVRHHELGPLCFAESMALIDETVAARNGPRPSDRQRKRLWALAEGNPEVLRAGVGLAAEAGTPVLPSNLLHSARQALARLSPRARTLIQFASVMRPALDLEVCALAAGMTPPGAAEALAEAQAAGLLRAHAERVDFVRVWFRKAVHDDLAGLRRRAMHGAVAAAIRRADRGERAPRYRALAYHCQAAGQAVAAAEAEVSALELSFARGARRGLPSALNRLVGDLDAHREDARSAAIAWRAGALRAAVAQAKSDPAAALAELRGLERRGPRENDPAAAIALFHALSRALGAAGDDEEAGRYARRTLRLSARHAGAAGPWCLAERLLFRLHLHGPSAERVIAGLQTRAQRARRQAVWSAAGEIAAAQAMMEGLNGRREAMEDSFTAAHKAVAKLRDPRAEVVLLQTEGMVRVWTGGAPEALTALERALALARAGGDVIRACIVRGLRGRAHGALGHVTRARTDLDQAIAAAVELEPLPYLPLFHAWLADVNGRSGRRAEAARQAHRAWRLSHGQAWTRPAVLRALAGALARRGSPESALAELASRRAAAVRRSIGLQVGQGDRV